MIELIALVGFKLATLTLGGLITVFAYRAYRRTGDVALYLITIGFGIITVGAFLAGIVDQVLPTPTAYALLVEATCTVVGFTVILCSLYV